MGQGLHLHGGGDPGAFDGVGFHKLHPGGGVEEQVPDDNGGAVGAARLGFFKDFARFQMKADAFNRRRSLGQQVDAADGGDGGQSFATEAHRADGGQVLGGAQLACCVAQERGPGVLGAHAAAVVRDPQVGHTAVLDLYSDLGSSGVHGVFQQLLDHGGRTLHHLAGGD